MRWDDLSLLLQVSRSTTMTEAAKRLGVDQTTISRRLRRLEEELGVQLVVRRRDGIDLTEAGLSAARSAEVMETLSLDLERNLVGTDATLRGRLRITTVEAVTHLHADLFTSFGQRFEAIELEVETHSGTRSLARREADLAIRWLSKPPVDLVAHHLATAEFALYATPSLRRRIGPRRRLSSYPWLAVRAGLVPHIDAFMQRHAATAHLVCRYEDLLALAAAVRTGAGVGFLPCVLGDADPELVRVRAVQRGFGFGVWCLTHPDLRGTARVRAFIEHTQTYFAERAELYAGRAPRR